MEVGMAPAVPDRPKKLPVGSVVEQRQDGRTFLVVQETPDRVTIIETWDDGIDVVNRLLGRLKRTLDNMNVDMAASNKRLAAGLRKTSAKIAANQRLLDEIVKSDP
jgi:aminoglycoside phosphotransferase